VHWLLIILGMWDVAIALIVPFVAELTRGKLPLPDQSPGEDHAEARLRHSGRQPDRERIELSALARLHA